MECIRQVLPMHQVLADGVSPGHVAPGPAEGVALVEEVVLALVVDQAVGVVVPTPGGSRNGICGRSFSSIERIEVLRGVPLCDAVEDIVPITPPLLGHQRQILTPEIVRLEIDPEVGLAGRELDCEFAQTRHRPAAA